MKKITSILVVLLALVGCGNEEPIEPIQEEVIEEVVEPTTYIVEFDELQTQLLDEINSADLVDYKQDNGDGTSTYEIPLDKKEVILHNLAMWLDADCSDIWIDNEEWVEEVYHSANFQLFKVYLLDASKNAQDTFSTLYAKRLFELGLIYNKLDENNSWIFINYYDRNGNKLNYICSDTLGL